jgi:hypothetical protein
LKLDNPAPAEPISEPADDAGFGDFGGDDMGGDAPDFGGDSESNDKPFDDEPFDAGVEADEATDPKKFIEQLTGKLGQSLRKYTEEQGQPDFELEKFAINSLLSATHTAEMDSQDKEDIIKKVNTSGSDGEDNEDTGSDNPDDSSDDFGDFNEPSDEPSGDFGDDENSDEEDLQEFSIYENKMDNLFLDKPKKNNMFQEGSNDILDEMKPCWKGYKQVGMKEKDGKEVPNCVPVNENHDAMGGESNNYMFWQNLKTINHASGELLRMDQAKVDDLIANGHAWAVDHIATSSDDIEEVYHFLESNLKENLNISENISIFDKDKILSKLQETFNQDEPMNEPMVEPEVKPVVKPAPSEVQPNIAPSRKNKPFLPMPEVTPDPKAIKEGKFDYEVYHKTLASCFNEAENYAIKRGYDPIEFGLSDPQHVSYGQTQRYNKELTVNGKLQRKAFHMQVYRMDSGNYELNMYVN